MLNSADTKTQWLAALQMLHHLSLCFVSATQTKKTMCLCNVVAYMAYTCLHAVSSTRQHFHKTGEVTLNPKERH